MGDQIRLDKWLWAARFFKTRSLAQAAVEGGRVQVSGQRVKPACRVRVGDHLFLQMGEVPWEVVVLDLSARRGPAIEARRLYQETEGSQQRREALSMARRLAFEPAKDRHGRPTKRDRRQIARWQEAS